MTDDYCRHTIIMSRIITLIIATALFAVVFTRAADAPPAVEFTAIVAKGGGLWPQVQVLADGTLLAFGYNAPAHTTLPGDVDAWASADGGKTWALRATAAARPDAKANMCHWASGFTAKGELLVVASGMDDAANERGQRAPNDVRVFRSADGGATWTRAGDFPKMLGGLKPYPFGSIVKAHDGSLHTVVYTSDEKQAEAAWLMTSRDDGRSWREAGKIADGINESVLLPLPKNGWLCVARTSNKPAPEHGQELRQFRSTDDGATWHDEGLIADYHKHPPHLLRLKDGHILLTYGNRRDGSIETRLTADEGKTWGAPQHLFTTGPGDMGYPSSVQLPDGKLATVFYANQSPLHDGYHMGAVGWTAPQSFAASPIYRLDVSGLNQLDLTRPALARRAWDTLHAAASLQGIVNRDGATLFLRHMPETDDFWWDYLRKEKQWLHGRPVIELRDLADAVKTFAPKLKGVVLYDSQVAATSSLASTIAGVEDRLALRHDPAVDSVFTQLATLAEFPKDVLRLFQPEGTPLFTGKEKIPDTTLDSTGSAKNDAYLWAKARYLDAGKCNREFLAYYLDSHWLKNPAPASQGPNQGLSNTTLANHDFFISQRAFFFDLGVWPEESPVDDPSQNPGTDAVTLRAILRSMAEQSRGDIFTVGGMVPWLWKYSGPLPGWAGSGGGHHPVHSEWEFARLISAYNGMMDADAMGGMANASFYQHYPLKARYPQQRKPTLEDLKQRGLIRPDGTVRPDAYIALYMGDYDAASWFQQYIPKWWADPQHGKVTCNWAFNPILDRRAPHAVDYVRTHAAATDWFICGDSGMGYLNPGMLTAPRLDPSIGDGWEAWIKLNEAYFRRYDLSIAGFVIEGFGPFMGKRGLDAYARFAPDGMMLQTSEPSLKLIALHAGNLPYIRHRTDLDGPPVQAAAALLAKMAEEKPHFTDGPQFLMARTVLKSPTWHAETIAATQAAPGGERVTFLDAHSFFLLLKSHQAHSPPVSK